jgi:hypothetical protein
MEELSFIVRKTLLLYNLLQDYVVSKLLREITRSCINTSRVYSDSRSRNSISTITAIKIQSASARPIDLDMSSLELNSIRTLNQSPSLPESLRLATPDS